MKRILIIGISGTGKSTLAFKLGNILDIPVYHYDAIYWKPNWTDEDGKIVEQRIHEVLGGKEWILEGYIEPASKERLEQADTIIYLDYSGFQSAIGGVQRWWKYRGKKRPEMAEGCIEKLDWNYIKVMWRRDERKEVENAIIGYENKTIRLKSRKELNTFLNDIPQKQIE